MGGWNNTIGEGINNTGSTSNVNRVLNPRDPIFSLEGGGSKDLKTDLIDNTNNSTEDIS